jgi:hypothetical protein
MTTIMQQQPMSNDIRQQGPSSNLQQHDAKEALKNQENAANIPEIIEERRRDSEGRTINNKYIRGKLLGKVNHINSSFLSFLL